MSDSATDKEPLSFASVVAKHVSAATEYVARADLLPADSPREAGVITAHVNRLVVAPGPLPPIVVHRRTMRIVDGMHRFEASGIRNEEMIAVKFFDGTEQEAFVYAVGVNSAQGLPLSLGDRKFAARRILEANPEWSDRKVGSISGLSHGTVAAIRRDRLTGQNGQSHSRIGRDGKLRPLASGRGRTIAADLIRSGNNYSLREISRKAGISTATVRDVRTRLGRGDDPVPEGRKPTRDSHGFPSAPKPADNRPVATHVGKQRDIGPRVPPTALHRLREDPALRFNDRGRTLIRTLVMNASAVEQVERLTAELPHHCRITVGRLARSIGSAWGHLADQLSEPDEGADDEASTAS